MSSSVVPPVVDQLKRTTIQEIKTKSIFNIFNIVAVVAILVIGYFLYKKFTEKFRSGAIRVENPEPQPVVEAVAAPVVVQEAEEEVPDSKED